MEMITIKVTSSFMVGGEIAKPGEIVEVTNAEAKDLLHRGMAELATADDEVLPVVTEEAPADANEDEEAPAKTRSKKAE